MSDVDRWQLLVAEEEEEWEDDRRCNLNLLSWRLEGVAVHGSWGQCLTKLSKRVVHLALSKSSNISHLLLLAKSRVKPRNTYELVICRRQYNL